MANDKRSIIRIINFAIEELGLFTNSKTHQKVIDRFEKGDPDLEIIKYILTSGEPPGEHQCRECGVMLDSEYFGYYQTRVDGNGHLMRSNALCKICSSDTGNVRHKVLKSEGAKIPPKPKNGSVCPKCNRQWYGSWHRHHVGDKFVNWWCSNCNMSHQDQRNPNSYDIGEDNE